MQRCGDGDCDTKEECLSGLCGDNNCDPQMFDTLLIAMMISVYQQMVMSKGKAI